MAVAKVGTVADVTLQGASGLGSFGAVLGPRTREANGESLQGVGIQLHPFTRDVSSGVVVRYCHPRHRVCCRSVDRPKGDVSAWVHNYFADDATRYARPTEASSMSLDED